MSPISAIVFDLDNTLWEVWPVIVRAEQAMYEYLGARYPRITAQYGIEALRTVREQLAVDEPHMGHDFTYLRLASLRRCAREAGYEECIAEEVFAVFYRARNEVTLYRDVEPALARLHGRYRLFTLTNGNADLSAIGLDRYFDASFAARSIGALKPHPSVFKHVLERAGLPASEVAHIGDDPIADVQGARAAGMHSFWLNRRGDRWPEGLGAVPATFAKLDEFVAALAG